MDYDRYRYPERRIQTLYKCYECATLTTNHPDLSGVSLCPTHGGKQ